jgi:uncharacterized protein (TIGR02391 family)
LLLRGGGFRRRYEQIPSAARLRENALQILRQQVASVNQALRPYGNLDLHPEIARAASELYRDGHYANAIDDAVKALNGLVRMRSGETADGTTLMQCVFSPKNPILRFNDLEDQTDQDEQQGFMMMFTGAPSTWRALPRLREQIGVSSWVR